MKQFIGVLIAIAFLVFGILFARHEIHWNTAKSTNSYRSYQVYIEAHPRGRFVEQASERQQSLLVDDVPYNTAMGNGTTDALLKFLEEFPGHKRQSYVQTALIPKLAQWEKGRKVADALETTGWVPSTNKEKVYYWVAKRKRGYLVIFWDITRQVLVSTVKSPDNRDELENAVYALVGLGIDEILPELLGLMDTHGNKDLAEAYLNCNHALLESRAEKWAEARGYTITSDNSGHRPISWGGM